MSNQTLRQSDAADRSSIPLEAPAPETGSSGGHEALDTYNTVAETVGGVPSLRMKDNLVQLIVVAGCAVIGALVCGVVWGWMGVVGGAAGGVAAGGLVSGAVLMVVGWGRAAKRLRGDRRPVRASRR